MNRFYLCMALSIMLAFLPLNTACSSTAQPLDESGTSAKNEIKAATPAVATVSADANAEESPELHRDLDISRALLAGLLQELRGSNAHTGAIEASLLSPGRMLFVEVRPAGQAAQRMIQRDIRTQGRVIVMRDEEAGDDAVSVATQQEQAAHEAFSRATREAGLAFLADYVTGLDQLRSDGEILLLLRDAGTDKMLQLSATRAQIEQLRSGRVSVQQFENRVKVRAITAADRALVRFTEVMATGLSAHPDNPMRVVFEAPVYAEGLGLMLRAGFRTDANPRMIPRVSLSDRGRRILQELPAENIESIEIITLPEGGQEIRINQVEADAEVRIIRLDELEAAGAEAEAALDDDLREMIRELSRGEALSRGNSATFEVQTLPGGAREVRVIQAEAKTVSGMDGDFIRWIAESDSLYNLNIAGSDSLFMRTMAEQDSLFRENFGAHMQSLGEMLGHLSGSLQALRGGLVATMDSLRSQGAFNSDSLRGQVMDFDFDFDVNGLAERVRDEVVSNITVMRRGGPTGGASFWPGRVAIWRNERQREQAEIATAETLHLLTEYVHLLRSLSDDEHLYIALDMQAVAGLMSPATIRLYVPVHALRARADGTLSEEAFREKVVRL